MLIDIQIMRILRVNYMIIIEAIQQAAQDNKAFEKIMQILNIIESISSIITFIGIITALALLAT